MENVKCYIIHFHFQNRATSWYKRIISYSADTTRRTELPFSKSATRIPFHSGENEQCFSFSIYGHFLLRVKATRMRIDTHTHTYNYRRSRGLPGVPMETCRFHALRWPLCIRKCVIWRTQNLFHTHKLYQKMLQMQFWFFGYNFTV
jgi:hypothetical protein